MTEQQLSTNEFTRAATGALRVALPYGIALFVLPLAVWAAAEAGLIADRQWWIGVGFGGISGWFLRVQFAVARKSVVNDGDE